MVNSKRLLYSTLDLVTDQEIWQFYNEALDNAPKEFWKVAASSTGKYHPPENNVEGGLVWHTLKCVLYAFDFAEHEYFLLPVQEKNIKRDIVVVAAGCHDIKKGGEPWDKYDPKHGELAANYLAQFDLRNPEKNMIQEAVYFHMNRMHDEKEQALSPDRPPYVRIVQYSDIAASRKWNSFIPGSTINYKKIKNYSLNDLKQAFEMLWQRKE